MSIANFSYNHGISIESVHTHLYKHKEDRAATKTNEYGELLIDAHYFVRRREFKARVRNEMHSYFLFFEEHFNSLEISRAIHKKTGKFTAASINTFLCNSFREDQSTVLNYKVPSQQWHIYRALRHLAMRTLKASGAKIPKGKRLIDVIEKILDRRTIYYNKEIAA